MEWVDQFRRLQGPHERRHADRRAHRAQLRRRGHRPVPHRAHVLPARAHPRGARDDPRGRRGGPARRAREDPADAARRLRRAVPRDGRAAGAPSACSIRRSTSSCRTRRREIEEVARRHRQDRARTIAAKVAELTEANPMLGHRGCRLAITYPGDLRDPGPGDRRGRGARRGARASRVHPEIMIPLVMVPEELRRLRALVAKAMDAGARRRATIPYTIGTMIELPRACVVADRIAEHADFFSFGTNDLTQTTFGLSRDDAGRFLPAYVDGGVLPNDPFAVLDPDGVGALIELGRPRRAGDQARASRSGSAASTAASRAPSSSATGPDLTTYRARRSGCRLPGSRRPGPRCPRRQVRDRTSSPTRQRFRARGRSKRRTHGGAVLLLVLRGCRGCTASAEEVRPPADELFFPTGAAVSPDERFLFVANANSELRYDSGTISRDRSRARRSDRERLDRRTATSPSGCEQDPDHMRDADLRRGAASSSPNAGARIGNFATDIAVQDTGNGTAAPDRADARRSVDHVARLGRHEASAATRRRRASRCATRAIASRTCTTIRSAPLPDEPFDVFADSSGQFAVVTHLTTGAVTLIDSPIGGNATIADVLTACSPPDPLTGLRGATGVAGRGRARAATSSMSAAAARIASRR